MREIKPGLIEADALHPEIKDVLTIESSLTTEFLLQNPVEIIALVKTGLNDAINEYRKALFESLATIKYMKPEQKDKPNVITIKLQLMDENSVVGQNILDKLKEVK